MIDGGAFADREQDVVIGIDQSLTGFATTVLVPATNGYYTTVFSSKASGVDRLFEIQDHMVSTMALIETFGSTVVHVAMEGYAPAAKFGREKMGECGAAVKLELRRLYGSPVGYPTIVAVSAVKKFTTGSGNAKKNQVMLAVFKKWGVEFASDDMADSYAIARVAAALHTRSVTFAYEQEVLDQLLEHTEWEQRPTHPKRKSSPSRPEKTSSESAPPPPPSPSPQPSATGSTSTGRSRSGRSEPVRSIKRSRRAPSPDPSRP